MQQVKLATSLGDIIVDLDDVKAPISVANFLKYVTNNYYNGTIFHRVIKNFMVQGGGFKPGMVQQTTDSPIECESKTSQLRNVRGAIAMARTTDPDTATAQFFINSVDNPYLDWDKSQDGWGYAVFGQVSSGLDVIDQINQVSTHRVSWHDDVPTTDVVLISATLLTPAQDAPPADGGGDQAPQESPT